MAISFNSQTNLKDPSLSNESGSVLVEASASLLLLLVFIFGSLDLLFLAYNSILSHYLVVSTAEETGKIGITGTAISSSILSRVNPLMLPISSNNICVCPLDLDASGSGSEACLTWDVTSSCEGQLTSNRSGDLFMISVRYRYPTFFGLLNPTVSASAIGRYEPTKL